MHTSSHDSQAARSRRLTDENVRGLVSLLGRRSELRGVHPMADHVVESFTWSV